MRLRTIALFPIVATAALGQQFALLSWKVTSGNEAIATFGAPRSEEVVTNAPYSAEQVQEYTPASAAGTGDTKRYVIGRFARDSQGRTRSERAIIPPRPAGNIESLGSRNIDGVMAVGTRNTGRALAIETWDSRELHVPIESTSSNGYFMRLEKLSRAEPEAALFRPPADYQVVDEKEPFTMTIRSK